MISISYKRGFLLTKLEKRIRKLHESPRNVSSRELISILQSLGFNEVGGKGSHRAFKHQKLPATIIVVPNQDPLKAVYVSRARKIIDELMEILEDEK